MSNTKQTYSFYSSNNTTVTVDWSNVPNDCSAILVTYYMKFYETHFEDYIQKHTEVPLHQKITDICNKFPKNIQNLPRMV